MPNDQTEEHRRAPRISIGVDLLCSSGRDEGRAVLVNLSPSGALLEAATLRPEVGSSVSILFPTTSIEELRILATVVVRHAPNGFAVKFRVFLPLITRLMAEYSVDA